MARGRPKGSRNGFNIRKTGSKPLCVRLGIQRPSQYLKVSLDDMRMSRRVTEYVTGMGVFTMYDLINSTPESLGVSDGYAEISEDDLYREISKYLISVNRLTGITRKYMTAPIRDVLDADDIMRYADVSVNTFRFPARFRSFLTKKGIKSLGGILQLSINGVLSDGRIGIKTATETVYVLQEFFDDPPAPDRLYSVRPADAPSEEWLGVGYADRVLRGEEADMSALTPTARRISSAVLSAADETGAEMYFFAREHPGKARDMAEILEHCFGGTYASYSEKYCADAAFLSIPGDLRGTDARLLYDAFSMRTGVRTGMPGENGESVTVADFYRKTCSREYDGDMRAAERFLSWTAGIDLPAAAAACLTENAVREKRGGSRAARTDRYWSVLTLRAGGATLKDVGEALGVTRERARQIETKYIGLIAAAYRNGEYDVLMLIRALRGGGDVMTRGEAAEYIGDEMAGVLWLTLSAELLDNGYYVYAPNYDAVVFGENNLAALKNIDALRAAMPLSFYADRYDAETEEAAAKAGVSRELVDAEAKTRYRVFGTFWSTFSPSVGMMCSHILETKYPDGYRIATPEGCAEFRGYLKECFGDRKGDMTDRALDWKVTDVGVHCGYGKYIHPRYVKIDMSALDAVRAYMNAGSKAAVTYRELYSALEPELNAAGIDNRYFFQGVLKLYAKDYRIGRNYLSKDDGRSYMDEFETFAKERKIFHKSEYLTYFPGNVYPNLAATVARSGSVFSIDNGYYMHESALSVTPADMERLSGFMERETRDGTVSSRVMYGHFAGKFQDFGKRNDITDAAKMYGILSHLFGKEYVFSRPYVSRGGTAPLTNREVILEKIGGRDSISAEGLVTVCRENGVIFSSRMSLVRMVAPVFIKSGPDTLIRSESAGITDGVLHAAAKYVGGIVVRDSYCGLGAIRDYGVLPQIRTEWNTCLLASVLEISDIPYKELTSPNTLSADTAYVYVGPGFEDEDYESFIIAVSAMAVKKGIVGKRADLTEYLYGRGLIPSRHLPRFITDAGLLSEKGKSGVSRGREKPDLSRSAEPGTGGGMTPATPPRGRK